MLLRRNISNNRSTPIEIQTDFEWNKIKTHIGIKQNILHEHEKLQYDLWYVHIKRNILYETTNLRINYVKYFLWLLIAHTQTNTLFHHQHHLQKPPLSTLFDTETDGTKNISYLFLSKQNRKQMFKFLHKICNVILQFVKRIRTKNVVTYNQYIYWNEAQFK